MISESELDSVLTRTLDRLRTARRTPSSTYRLQFHAGFTFRDAAAIVPYLHSLGVTHCYASPYLKATPGSTHGYDVVDHAVLNPELGTRADYDAWVAAMDVVGMKHILDCVPNHMGIGSDDNERWNDLLREGPDGDAGKFFDVAWQDSPRPELKRRVLLPTLGEPYGAALEKGDLKLVKAANGFAIQYFDRHFPLDPKTCAGVNPDSINGRVGDPRSFDALDALLERQHFRLACWRTASDEINYRRFFDVSTLAALAMERPEVFDKAHALIFDLLAEGNLAGLRIDHSDGLYDPKAYFLRLQRQYVVALALRELNPDRTPTAVRPDLASKDLRARLTARIDAILPDDATDFPLYVVTEKILAPGEPLPSDWAMDGTSGYDILNEINGLFIDPRGQATLDACYRNFVGPGVDDDYHALAYRKKREVLTHSFAGELNLLVHQLDRLAQRDRHSRDFTLDVLRDALRELVSSFGVYRTYVTATGPSARDVEVIDAAVAAAKTRDATLEPTVFDFIRDALLLRGPWGATHRDEAVRFAGKFQQLTSPVTAKGLEDTAFYIYHRLCSLNEVGGEPARFGVSVDSLHDTFAARQRDWPRAMGVLSTHDTKRSEDVRARLHVLSELADEWAAAVGQWRALNRSEGVHPNDEYLLYQTLVGAWPIGDVIPEFVERINAYLLKAMREAKERTSWTAPNLAPEKAMHAFVERILDADRGRDFRVAFEPFRQRVARAGAINALAQTLVRLAAPGMLDTYQGTELWDLSLVDPDNRRPVDYARRERLLATLPLTPDAAFARRVARDWHDGQAKLLVTATTLRLRRERADLFARGTYEPLPVGGADARRAFTFARTTRESSAIVIVPRLIATCVRDDGTVDPGDASVTLPPGTHRNAFTGKAIETTGARLNLSDVLRDFPVALLMRE